MQGIDVEPATALVLSRAERNKMVIFDPGCVALIRPLILPADLRPWHVAPADRWLVTIPAGYTAQTFGPLADESTAWAAFAARHPALARQLEPHAAALAARPARGDYWWELLPRPSEPTPRILIAPGKPPIVAWDESGAEVAAPVAILAPATPLQLAILGSRYAARIAGSGGVAGLLELPLPALPAPTEASLSGLALSLATLSRQRTELEQAALRRLMADFGPPGATPNPRLEHWWELTFEELRAELNAHLRNDIPERYRPTWAEIHTDHQATRAEATHRITALEEALEAQVEAVFTPPLPPSRPAPAEQP